MSELQAALRYPDALIPFSKIEASEFLPNLVRCIEETRESISRIKEQKETPNFENVIVGLEVAFEQLDQLASIFYALNSAENSKEIQDISPEFSEKITSFSNDVFLDADLFNLVQRVYEQKKNLQLDDERGAVLEHYYQDFLRNGALLSDEKKQKLRSIDKQLSQQTLDFAQNLLKANNAYQLVVHEKERLNGLPESALEMAKAEAHNRKIENAWVFTLKFPSYYPLLSYCQDRDLRREISLAFSTLATSGEWDNQKLIQDIVSLRRQRAGLLGHPHHAAYVLQKRMAAEAEKVLAFIEDLAEKALPKAKGDRDELEAILRDELGASETLEAWDVAYCTEKLKQKKLGLDEEKLRAFFPLEQVKKGIFEVAAKLYNLNFEKIETVEVWHPDVELYKVSENGELVGHLYLDFFPRETKKAGAWMMSLRDQGLHQGRVLRPFIGVVCNFAPPSANAPSLLTLNEVRTFFHEFGHALHGLLSRCHFRKLSGTNVFWDFVELPSQIMENWMLEKEVLDLFAKHYETGELLPDDLLRQIRESDQFLQGYATVRQLSFALLDMHWHLLENENELSVKEFEEKVLKDYRLINPPAQSIFSCGFSHIFAGGYSAGYYSYKWAEVLDADAFEYFTEEGLFSPTVSQKFREFILEKGGTQDPMHLYEQFRGRAPRPEALLKRAGLA